MEIDDINEQGPISVMRNFYKFPSCDFPKDTISNSESIDIERYNSFKKRRRKNVHFNDKVTIVNIKRYKKNINKKKKKKYYINNEDFTEEEDKKCVKCNIF